MTDNRYERPAEDRLSELGFAVEHIGYMKTEDYEYTRLIHKKSGGRVTICHREDRYKTFSIVFRTSPVDDSGVFHILEHSVLCGSRKFPVRDPFTEVMKGSLNVYMNAFTGADRTYYPFSTPSEQDFFNLAEVYLDSVFDPLVMEEESIFLQEGHRLERIEGSVGYGAEDFTRTGVVFNEMEGAYSSVDDHADYHLSAMMFPGGTYAYDSGGHPDRVEELTYEALRDTYRRFYKPQSCMVFVDGGVDCDRLLTLLCEYFDRYGCDGTAPALSLGGDAITYNYKDGGRCVHREPYPSSEGNKKATLYLGWRGAGYADSIVHDALTVAFDTVCDSNTSRLKQAVLARGVCEDLVMSHAPDGLEAASFAQLIGVEPDRAEEAVSVFMEELRLLIEEGIDRQALTATLRQVEFATRTMDYGTTPRGVRSINRYNSCFLYGDEPERYGDMDALFAPLYEMLDDRGYEKELKSRLLDTLPTALLMVPDPEMAERRRRQAKERLTLALPKDEQGRAELEAKLARYSLRQEGEDSREALSTVPSLALSDLVDSPPLTESHCGAVGGVPIIHNVIKCNGVSYMEIRFDLSDLPRDKLCLPTLYSILRREMPTESGSAAEFNNKLRMKVGYLSTSTSVIKQGDEPRLYLTVRTAALKNDTVNIPEILREAIYTADFTDLDMLERRLEQYLLMMEESLDDWAPEAVTTRALGMYDRSEALKDIATLHSATQRIKEIAESREAIRELSVELEWLKSLLTPDRAIISLSADELDLDLLRATVTAIARGSGAASQQSDIPLSPDGVAALTELLRGRQEKFPCSVELFPRHGVGFAITGGTSYAHLISNFKTEGGCAEHNGSFSVFNNIMNLGPLWEQVRVRGGAYGTGISAKANTGGIVVNSYRDPCPGASLEVFRSIPELMEELLQDGDDRELEQYLISTLGYTEGAASPRVEGSGATTRILCFIDGEEITRKRRQIISTDRSALLGVGEVYRAALSRGTVAVAAPRRILEELGIEEILEF